MTEPKYCCMGGKHDWYGGHHFDDAWSGCMGWCGGWTSCGMLSSMGYFRTKLEAHNKTIWRQCTR